MNHPRRSRGVDAAPLWLPHWADEVADAIALAQAKLTFVDCAIFEDLLADAALPPVGELAFVAVARRVH